MIVVKPKIMTLLFFANEPNKEVIKDFSVSFSPIYFLKIVHLSKKVVIEM